MLFYLTIQDADFFNPSYTVAAHTGNYVWEGCWVFVDFLKESLGEKIKGKKIIGILSINFNIDTFIDSVIIFRTWIRYGASWARYCCIWRACDVQ